MKHALDTIRNFVIIAHVDHGKSTLADRLLEITKTVPERRMQAQYLDRLELERERGITIKMAPVRMEYEHRGVSYTLNLIDTPGHSDFSYEVSRALEAVEGAVLLVDATQGIQAQTLANYRSAKAAGLTVIGAVNKIDLVPAGEVAMRREHIARDLAKLIGTHEEDIFFVSGKTGEGVPALLEAVVERLPAPRSKGMTTVPRALVFDSFYDNHKGVVASIRVFDGTFRSTDTVRLLATATVSKLKELGCFTPELRSLESLEPGTIGYLATGVKDPGKIRIGDTVVVPPPNTSEEALNAEMLPGYREPHSVVFVSFYPEGNDDYEMLIRSLEKLKLNDAALTIEPDQNEVLGRGFKVGFLGRLHYEIGAERLRREFGVQTVNTFPSVAYRAKTPRGMVTVVKPEDLPTDALELWEPTVSLSILVPPEYVPRVMNLAHTFRISGSVTETQADRVEIRATMPLAELVSDFDDQLKSATGGYASFSYELADYVKADIVRVDVQIAGNQVPGLSRFYPRESYEREARAVAQRLKDILPREQFSQAIQAIADGRVVAREDIPAMKKQLGNFGKNGGDRTRKMKLWAKQKRGKKRLLERAETKLTPEVFRELLKK